MILPGAEPFFIPRGPHGVLMVHGFTGLPAELLPMGQFLSGGGFTVLGVRLVGHATTPEDMSHVTQENWMDSVRDGYGILSGYAEKISVVGHSMGGLLSLRLAAEKPVAGIVSIAAPIFVAEERGLRFLPPREVAEGQYVPKMRRRLKNVPDAVNNNYRMMSLISVHELVDAIDIAKECLAKVTAPALIIQGEEDHTADPKSADYIFEHIGASQKEVFRIPQAGHLLPMDDHRDEVFLRVSEFLKGL